MGKSYCCVSFFNRVYVNNCKLFAEISNYSISRSDLNSILSDLLLHVSVACYIFLNQNIHAWYIIIMA